MGRHGENQEYSMSAFVVDPYHVRWLRTYAGRHAGEIQPPVRTRNADGWAVDSFTHDEAATLLFNECVRSVAYRYQDCTFDTLPGRIGCTFPMSPETIWHPIRFRTSAEFDREFTPGRVLAACACLEYQSCETPDYFDTPAYEYLNSIRRHAMRSVPGYDEVWEIKEPQQVNA